MNENTLSSMETTVTSVERSSAVRQLEQAYQRDARRYDAGGRQDLAICAHIVEQRLQEVCDAIADLDYFLEKGKAVT